MGKKNKKQSQKRRQAKSLKRRSKQKEFRKNRPQKSAQQYPGMPGNLTPEMQAQLNKMALFSAPLISLGDPEDLEEMQQMAPFVQGFWQAFSEQDLEKRREILEALKEAYEEMPWAKVDFEELTEFLLKRHIHFAPGSHSKEERSRYSPEELQAAVAQKSLLPEDEEEYETDEEKALDKFRVRDASNIPEFDPEVAKSLFKEGESAELENLREYLTANYDKIDFIDESNAVLQKNLDFQNRALDLFRRYLEHIQLSEEEVAEHLNNVRPFFDPFLKEFHQASIFNCDEDQVEEYLLDYYIRKVEHTPESEKLLIDSFAAFFDFAGKMEFIENAQPILERIAESKEEFADLWEEEEEE